MYEFIKEIIFYYIIFQLSKKNFEECLWFDRIKFSSRKYNKNFRIKIQRNRELKKRKLFNLRQI
jgi:hypothetical protein